MQKFVITHTILDQIYAFVSLYAPLTAIKNNERWFSRTGQIVMTKSAFAAVSIDKNLSQNIDFFEKTFNIREHLAGKEYTEYQNYLKVAASLKKSFYADNQPDYLLLVKQIHSSLSGLPDIAEDHFRSRIRLLPKSIWENGVYKTVKLEIQTRPEDIKTKLVEFIDWLNVNQEKMNPILLAGIAHFKIAEIHPFTDGNGRLARLVERGLLYSGGIKNQDLLPIEEFYLKNRERYYDLLEDSINSNDLTEWLEFYTEGVLTSVIDAVRTLYRVSGGAIDVAANRYEQLTDREEQIIELISEMDQASGAEIAKKLNVSRQNVNTILKRLHKRNLLEKIGSSTSSRYKLVI